MGLSCAQAADRLARHGPNVLPRSRPVPWWRRLLAQVVHFFALLLWAAAGLAAVAGMPQLAVAIVVVVLVNAVFAHLQEERASRAAARLRELVPARVLVRRDGRTVQVDVAQLVEGDLVVLCPGDRVPADVQLVVAVDCAVDESTLSGESVPVVKSPGEPAWAGTFLVTGEVEALVRATGAGTRLAGIAALTTAARAPTSPLTRELHRIVRVLAVIAVLTGAAFLLAAVPVGIGWRDGFLLALGVMVAMVPEGLLPTVTLSLAVGAQRMADRNGLVRHVEALETLGAATFICTDKTGTLTRNQMSVVEAWTPAGVLQVQGEGYAPAGRVTAAAAARAAGQRLARAAVAASEGRAALQDGRWVPAGDPMEAALDAFAHRVGGDPAPDPVRRFPFDPSRRRESALVGDRLYVKGAPETILSLSAGGTEPSARNALQGMTSRGLRVLAVAERPLPATLRNPVSSEAADYETGLHLLGLIGMQDPPRESVPGALAAARRAGIRVAMITGDHPDTAAAIARQIGLLTAQTVVLTGAQLPEDDEELGTLVDRDGLVLSRVSPEQKLRVTRALQRTGHVVAMTGDGVNDAPALQEADIGVAMGRAGTDVAREAADLVLLDDDFATIVAAIEQGRATYANIRRFLTYHLTSNVAELTPFVVWAMSAGQVPLALGVLQILVIDIGTDLLPALALGGEKPSRDVMARPPERRHLLDRRLLFRVFVVLGPVQSAVEMAAFLAVLWSAQWVLGGPAPDPPVLAAASGAAFGAVVLGQVANAFACRSATRPPWRLGWFGNRRLLGAVAVELILLALFLVVPPVSHALGHTVPTPGGAAVALLAIPAVLAADALHKALRRRSRRDLSAGATTGTAHG